MCELRLFNYLPCWCVIGSQRRASYFKNWLECVCCRLPEGEMCCVCLVKPAGVISAPPLCSRGVIECLFVKPCASSSLHTPSYVELYLDVFPQRCRGIDWRLQPGSPTSLSTPALSPAAHSAHHWFYFNYTNRPTPKQTEPINSRHEAYRPSVILNSVICQNTNGGPVTLFQNWQPNKQHSLMQRCPPVCVCVCLLLFSLPAAFLFQVWCVALIGTSWAIREY